MQKVFHVTSGRLADKLGALNSEPCQSTPLAEITIERSAGPAVTPEADLNRAKRDIVRLLTTDIVSIEKRVEILQLVHERLGLPREVLQHALNHSLEVAVLKDDFGLINAIRGIRLDGVKAQTTFKLVARRLGGGADGDVFAISDYHAAKKFSRSDDAQGGLAHDLSINEELYNNGVAVPQPVELKATIASALMGRLRGAFQAISLAGFRKSLFMERIHGTPRSDIDEWGTRRRAEEECENQYSKAKEAGIYPSDLHGRNQMYDASSDQAFLIDFSRWFKR